MFTPQPIVSDRPPWRSLVRIALNVGLGFVIVGPLVGFAIASAFYHGNLLTDLEQAVAKPGLVDAALIMQGIVTFIGLIIFPLIHLLRLEQKSLDPFFPRQDNLITGLLVVAGIGLTFPIAISPIAEWNLDIRFPEFMKGFEDWALEEEERLARLTTLITDFDSPAGLVIGIVVIALLPAIGEELVFRGMIQHELWRATKNAHIAIWVSGIIFSAIHLQFFGFFPRVLLGVLFGYLYYWSGNLLLPIFSHFLNNAFAVVMVYLHNIGVSDINIEGGEALHWTQVTPSLIIAAGLIYYFRKQHVTSARTTTHADKTFDEHGL
jgi:membrane protease YdiL (CAAX protease family)